MAGILTCAASVLIFSMLGIKAAKYIPGSVKEYMTLLLSVLCFLVAITSIQKAADLMPVALALCVGGILGSRLQLTKKISTAAWAAAQKIDRLPFGRKKCTDPEIFQRNFVSVMTVICLSGAGIMGSLTAGTSSDQSMLFVKALLDAPVAFFFGEKLGAVVGSLAIPEILILSVLYLASGLLAPYLTAEAVGNLYACGGVVILASAFSMAGIREFSGANLIPGMIFVIPFSLLL